MTKRDRIIQYLKENGIDLSRSRNMEEREKWQRSGTVVLDWYMLRKDERSTLIDLKHKGYDDTCPIEVHQIRYHFERLDYYRVSIKKGF